MRETLKESDNWILQKDDNKKIIIISYFEDNHFCDEFIIDYDDLNFLK